MLNFVNEIMLRQQVQGKGLAKCGQPKQESLRHRNKEKRYERRHSGNKNAFVNANELSLVCTATAKLVTS